MWVSVHANQGSREQTSRGSENTPTGSQQDEYKNINKRTPHERHARCFILDEATLGTNNKAYATDEVVWARSVKMKHGCASQRRDKKRC